MAEAGISAGSDPRSWSLSRARLPLRSLRGWATPDRLSPEWNGVPQKEMSSRLPTAVHTLVVRSQWTRVPARWLVMGSAEVQTRTIDPCRKERWRHKPCSGVGQDMDQYKLLLRVHISRGLHGIWSPDRRGMHISLPATRICVMCSPECALHFLEVSSSGPLAPGRSRLGLIRLCCAVSFQ